MSPLYALTIWPEWIYAILHLGKDVEQRKWRYSRERVGMDIVLHTGACVGGSGPKEEGRANVKWFPRHVWEITGQPPPAGWTTTASILAGRPAAVATLGEPTLCSSSRWARLNPTVWAWPLLNVRPLPDDMPVIRGGQGLWPLQADLAAECRFLAGQQGGT